MKVIVAGFPKTGTKSMVAALLELDYKVFDFIDHFWYHGDEWMKIFREGGTSEDFIRMYKDVDAIADTPTFLFWEGIHKAFPDSKIILTTRDEDNWARSWLAQMDEVNGNLAYQAMQVFSPTGRKYFMHVKCAMAIITGWIINHPFDKLSINDLTNRRAFRQHQAYCLQNAPKDKLLVYNVKEGWEPLCKFLNKEVPKTLFPHENVGAVIVAKLMANHPAMLRMQREMKIVLCALLGLGGFSAYMFYSKGGCDKLSNLFEKLNPFRKLLL